MRPLEDRPRLERLRQVGSGLVGGLIVTGALAARDDPAISRGDRENAVWFALVEGLDAAAEGRLPPTRVERLPSWIVAVMRARLRDHEFYWLDSSFVEVRIVELLGLAELRVDDDYVLSMVTGLLASRSWNDNVWGDPLEWFRFDPELVERAYWRAYEIEGDGVVGLRVEPGGPTGSSWRSVTLRMIGEGMIDRERVVEVCFVALDRDFSPAASQWFVRLLTDLALSDDELAARQPAIRRHLTHLSPAAAKNALAWLARLDRRQLLDDEETAPALEAAVLAPTKAAAMAAVRLLRTIHTRTPSVDVVTPARAGLLHAHLDVQRAAVELLRSAEAIGVLGADADQLQPSLQAELGLLPTPAPPVPSPGRVLSAGFDAATTHARAATRRDVTERLAALLERADDPIEIELVLDALARYGQTDLLTPLVKRARAVLAANEYHRLEQQLAALVLASTGSQVWPSVPQPPWTRFLHRRLTEVRQVLDGTSRPSPRLATPTSNDGQLHPAAFVERALRADLDLHRVDLIAALLRLASDGRDEALQAWYASADAVAPTFGRAVRHALGSEPEKGTRPDNAALWVAASRARDPLAVDHHLLDHGIHGAGRSRGLHAQITYASEERGRHFFGDEDDRHLTVAYPNRDPDESADGSPRAHPRSARPKSSARHVDQPTALHDFSSYDAWDDDLGWLDNAWAVWNATTWPADAEHYASTVIVPTFQARNWTVPDSTPHDVLATMRRHPGRFGPTVAATLALTMAAATAQTRIHASDTVIDLISRKRLTSHDVADSLVASAPVVVISRWRDTLERITAAGHPHITTDLLCAALPGLPQSQRGLSALIDQLHQDLLRTGRKAADPTLRSYLSTFTGSNKAAASARAVLAM